MIVTLFWPTDVHVLAISWQGLQAHDPLVHLWANQKKFSLFIKRNNALIESSTTGAPLHCRIVVLQCSFARLRKVNFHDTAGSFVELYWYAASLHTLEVLGVHKGCQVPKVLPHSCRQQRPFISTDKLLEPHEAVKSVFPLCHVGLRSQPVFPVHADWLPLDEDGVGIDARSRWLGWIKVKPHSGHLKEPPLERWPLADTILQRLHDDAPARLKHHGLIEHRQDRHQVLHL
mmetsp:Transcript_20802/g.49591  ORF Transcript_20802/g.49591 Transcript_20802/m.49591 type:complete len:231 (-) Transcript_20802:1459-2151(-)